MRRRTLPTLQEAAEILARRRTKPAPRPAPLAGKSLAPMLRRLEAQYGQGPGQLQMRWKEIVGETLARHTEPVKVTKGRGAAPGVLELKVAGPAAAIVQHQAPEILKRVSLLLGEGQIGKLRIIQGPVRVSAGKPQAKRRRLRGPLDAASEKALADGVAEATDGPLKEVLIKLGREVLRGSGS